MMRQCHRQSCILRTARARAKNEVTRLEPFKQVVQGDGVQPLFALGRPPLQDNNVSPGLRHCIGDVQRKRIEVVDEQYTTRRKHPTLLVQLEDSTARRIGGWMIRWLQGMDAEGSTGQRRVLLAHPTCCNPKCCSLPGRLLNLFFWF